MAESETDITTSIRQFIKRNYGFPTSAGTEFIYADCSLALFNKLVLCCIQEGGTLCFPAGSNGNYVSSAKFLKANILNVPTRSEFGFKLSEETLTGVFESLNNPWLYIFGPTINPTGLVYSNREMENILSVCAKFGAKVVIDTSFSGLEYDFEGCGVWDLEDSLVRLYSSSKPSFCVSLLGGLSLKLLTGGLTCGFLALTQPLLGDAFHSFPGLSKPHSTVKYTMKKLLSLQEQKTGGLMEAIAEQKRILCNRAKRLKQTLEIFGWEVLESHAGVSMVAKPSAYLNKVMRLKDTAFEMKINYSNIKESILRATGLCINSAPWIGIHGYCRFPSLRKTPNSVSRNESNQSYYQFYKLKTSVFFRRESLLEKTL